MAEPSSEPRTLRKRSSVTASRSRTPEIALFAGWLNATKMSKTVREFEKIIGRNLYGVALPVEHLAIITPRLGRRIARVVVPKGHRYLD